MQGRLPRGQSLCDRPLVQRPPTHLDEAGHDPPDHLAQKGIGGDVDRHQRPFPPDPDPVEGPDRLPVRHPEGGEVVPANEDRPGPRHRGGVEWGPHPERKTLAKRTPRPVPDGVAVLPIPRREPGMEPRRRSSQIADRDVFRQGRLERPTELVLRELAGLRTRSPVRWHARRHRCARPHRPEPARPRSAG